MAPALKAAMIGAGQRGYEVYGAYALAHPQEIRFVAVAEPNEDRRVRFAEAHDIPLGGRFEGWEDLLGGGVVADATFICTMDTLHTAPAIAALEAGYDVLVEKPMGTTLQECVRVVRAAERTGRLLQIAHVLRYTPFFSTLHDILASGRLGEIVTVEHRENVVYWHMAHSYVRGNWRRRDLSSPMILAKCCHDLDILAWNLGCCTRLSSFGGLLHFRPENAPAGAPRRCTDGCPVADECLWYAPRLYLELTPLMHVARRSADVRERMGAALVLDHSRVMDLIRRVVPSVDEALDYRGWPISAIGEDISVEGRRRALEIGPYGRCVYQCDNDVVDHQTVSMAFESGASAVLVMHGHSHEESRTMRYEGTRATLRGRFSYGIDDAIEIHEHRSGKVERLELGGAAARATGHGGGDEGVVAAFVRAASDADLGIGTAAGLTTARESLESHLLAFSADQARLEGCVIDMAGFRRRAEMT